MVIIQQVLLLPRHIIVSVPTPWVLCSIDMCYSLIASEDMFRPPNSPFGHTPWLGMPQLGKWPLTCVIPLILVAFTHFWLNRPSVLHTTRVVHPVFRRTSVHYWTPVEYLWFQYPGGSLSLTHATRVVAVMANLTLPGGQSIALSQNSSCSHLLM